ncbi:hypothetical protein DPMN_074439 [Dreissena polymorpha]|uniref:Uncharacterized protein n=1 Tax=Dreissena polymorpha TaxID=45954 RepID=A0A9D4BLK5_DREPO|nr:hypothetical protein DPMN_074439 [Dreissena polymorpha]
MTDARHAVQTRAYMPKNATSRKHVCNMRSLVFPEFNTMHTASLSQNIEIRSPFQVRDHNFTATSSPKSSKFIVEVYAFYVQS